VTPKAAIDDEAEERGIRGAGINEEQLLQCCNSYTIAGAGHASSAVAEVERDMISVDTDIPSEDVVALKHHWVHSISGIV
jgi:hypothetical protein